LSLPVFPPMNEGSVENSIYQILSSIAMEELALSHILNAEGEKLQYVLGTLDESELPVPLTIDEIIDINQSVKDMVQQVGFTQMLLLGKMTEALRAYEKSGENPPPPPSSLFSLSYDVNGGHTDGPATEVSLQPQQNHPLNQQDIPSHGGHNLRPVAFIGWTAAQDAQFYEKTDSLPDVITTVDIVDHDVTVYAVWGYDDNGNGIPDILEGEFTLTYDTNGGHNDGPPMEFNLLQGTTHNLSAIIPTHDADSGVEVIFLGWTEQRDITIYSKDDDASSLPPLLTSVEIPDHNVTVFALWGYDQNNNGMPDVYEDTFTLTYDTNGGNNDGPPTETSLLPNHYQLNSTARPSHAVVSGTPVLFVGWAAEPTPIYANTDDKNEVASKLITAVDIVDDNVTVYAMWGYDEDGDNIPDILEDMYTLTYDVNGGNNDGPASKVVLAQNNFPLNTTVTPTHATVGGRAILFLGWTAARNTTIYERSSVTPSTITEVDIHADTTVYALWGYANLPGLEATAALCSSVGFIDGYSWQLVRKSKIGSNTYLMLVAKNVISYGGFGANDTYEGSSVQAEMTSICANSPTLKEIAVIPNLGNPSYQIPTTTEPTAVMANGQTKDVFFAPSRQDALDGKNSCSWSFADHWWTRTALSGTSDQAWEWNPNAGTVNSSTIFATINVGYLPAVWVRAY